MSLRVCPYCEKTSRVFSEADGVLSTAVRDQNDHEVWFCSHCCLEMWKYTSGAKNMSRDLYENILRKCYPGKLKTNERLRSEN